MNGSAGVVTTDRKAYTWGYNAQRQLGVDTSASTVNVPTVVKTDASTELSDVVEIAAGMQQMSARVIEDASADPFTKVYAFLSVVTTPADTPPAVICTTFCKPLSVSPSKPTGRTGVKDDVYDLLPS